MLVGNALKALEYKIKAEAIALPPLNQLSELFFEAFTHICDLCVPNELIRKNSDMRVYRNIDNGFYIAMPERPIFDENDPNYDPNAHLMIDENLSFAAVDFVAFLITKNPFYELLCDKRIDNFIANDQKGGL